MDGRSDEEGPASRSLGMAERVARVLIPPTLRKRVWSLVVRWDRPLVTRAYLAVHPEFRPLRLTRRTALVIDGHSRCANTYAVCAFEHENPGLRLTHHLHDPKVFVRAARIGVPGLVLIRRPEDVVASMVQFEPDTTVRDVIGTFLAFYTPLLPILDELVIADFEEVVADFGAVVGRVNRRFGTSFVPYVKTPQAEQAVLAAVEAFGATHYAAHDFEARVSRPSVQRQRSRGRVEDWAEEDRQLLARARGLYDEVRNRTSTLPDTT